MSSLSLLCLHPSVSVQFFGLCAEDKDQQGCRSFGYVPIFLEMVPDIIVAKLSIIFLRLVRLGSFSEYWQSANVTAIPKGQTVRFSNISLCLTNFSYTLDRMGVSYIGR